jgi:hypothetical protein
MAATAQYASVPKIGTAVISTANTARDGTGTLGTVFTAGASGSRIDTIEIQATGTTTAGMIRLFISDGTNHRLFAEVPVIALTPSATIPAFSATVQGNAGALANGVPLPFSMATGWSLRASTHNAETFNVIGFGGDF